MKQKTMCEAPNCKNSATKTLTFNIEDLATKKVNKKIVCLCEIHYKQMIYEAEAANVPFEKIKK